MLENPFNNPMTVTTEKVDGLLAFLKSNVSEEVRKVISGNTDMESLLDLSISYIDILRENAEDMIDLIKEVIAEETSSVWWAGRDIVILKVHDS